ncbi:MAG: hypothetical protein COB29_01220 [Sulfitobacter sp.]|nr:MAG: hypothetical protein COB29_01220 [Sulfitobacter sp.]
MDDSQRSVKLPKWDGQPSSFGQFKRKFERFLLIKELAWVVDHVREQSGINAPGNAVRATEGRVKCYAYLAESVETEDVLDTIIANYNDGAVEEALAALPPNADQDDRNEAKADAVVGMNPQRLWTAISSHAKGPIKDLSGKDLHDQMKEMKFPVEGKYAERVTAFIHQLRDLLEQAERIQDAEYPITQAMLCKIFVDLMPERFQLEYASYRHIKKINELKTAADLDARRFDRTPHLERNMHAMVTPSAFKNESGLQVDHEQIMNEANGMIQMTNAQFQQLLGQSKGRDRGGRNKYESKARRLDKSAGPLGNDRWCNDPQHGWGNHDSAHCKKLAAQGRQASSRPSTAAASGNDSKHNKQITLVKNANDTYTLVTNMTNTFVSIADAVALLAQEGVIVHDMVFVDTASDLSWSNNLADLTNIVVLDPSTAPRVEGTNVGQPVIATHKGTRTNRAGATV